MVVSWVGLSGRTNPRLPRRHPGELFCAFSHRRAVLDETIEVHPDVGGLRRRAGQRDGTLE